MSGPNKKAPPSGGDLPPSFRASMGSLSLSDVNATASATGQAAATSAVSSTDLGDTRAISFKELPKATRAPAASPPTPGNSITVDLRLATRLSSLKDTLTYPVRTALRAGPKKGEVLTNYFEVTIDPKTFYKYQILNLPVSESRVGKKRYMDIAVQAVPFLNSNQHVFATDNISTIVPWTPLHQHAPGPRVQIGNPAMGVDAKWRLVEIVDQNTTAYLSLQDLRQVDIK